MRDNLPSLSPVDDTWPKTSKRFQPASETLKVLHHRWRVCTYMSANHKSFGPNFVSAVWKEYFFSCFMPLFHWFIDFLYVTVDQVNSQYIGRKGDMVMLPCHFRFLVVSYIMFIDLQIISKNCVWLSYRVSWKAEVKHASINNTNSV